MFKYALVFAFAGGAALFTGCRADEEVDLAGYPETPVGATISGTTDRVATFAGTYDNEGVLNLAGSLSGEYTIALAQASPEETVDVKLCRAVFYNLDTENFSEELRGRLSGSLGKEET